LQQVLIHLVKLQELDSQLQQLESLKGDLPSQVSRLSDKLSDAENNLKDSEDKLKAYQKERAITEMEIKAFEGKQTKYQTQLFNVKTNREYDAVTLEIENVKIEVGKKESRLLELMDIEEETRQYIETIQEETEKIKNQFDEKSIELKKRLANTEKDEAALHDQRDKLLRKLEKRIVATYDRIRNAKNGYAVVPVIRNACGGCFKTLPPQRILEIRQMNRLFLCEVCGRILVWDEQKSEDLG
jgi:predicted  nucleic acid-binding Zn-ribbon protein